jgi:putative inorganic carbon (HCO3(-)) transporter
LQRSKPILRLLEPFLLLAAAPLYLFPTEFPRQAIFVASGFLLVPFCIRKLSDGRFSAPTPVNASLAVILFGVLPLSIWATPLFWETTWPALACLLWSVALFFGVVNWAREQDKVGHSPSAAILSPIAWLTLAYLALGIILAAVSLLGMRPVEKMPIAGAMVVRLSRVAAECLGTALNFGTNEVAGMLILFLPLLSALFLGSIFSVHDADSESHFRITLALPKLSRHGIMALRLALLLLILFFSFVLILTQSRGGMFALALATGLVFILMGRAGRLLLGLCILSGGAGMWYIGPSRIVDVFLFTTSVERLSPGTVLTGRPEIWHRALHGIVDFSFSGMGLDSFQRVFPVLYPMNQARSNPGLEDAHNFYLQAALDLGLPGLLAFLLMLLLAFRTLVRLYRNTKANSFTRCWVIGVLGALTAHLLYSITDAVSLGARGGVALWFLLGLIMAAGNQRQIDRALSAKTRLGRPNSWILKIRNNPFILYPGLAIFIILFAVLFWPSLRQQLDLNRAAKLTAEALLADSRLLPKADAELARLAVDNCRAHWLRGLVAQARGQKAKQDSAWTDLIRCSPRFMRLLQIVAPNNQRLAELAVRAQPESAEAFFWLAKICTKDAPDKAIMLYREGLRLNPHDGLNWRWLGDLLARQDPQAAIEAYLQSCYNGDPGANGCWLAGRTAEQLGDTAAAIQYYRMSRWSGAHERAEKLEREMGLRQIND